uniref:PH domain-containing protein n=2 Tax=Timema TaxID=61471 RepID=A0A7R9CF81_TIMCR|nr:unnamed protein product [Timema cristinae]
MLKVFSSLPDTISLPTLREYESRIDEVCWLVCKKHYLHREHVVFSDSCVYKLFRIFCLLADLVPESSQVFQVLLAAPEVGNVAAQLVASLGLEWDAPDFDALSSAICAFRFSTFLAVLESKYSGSGMVEQEGLEEAVQDMYQTFLHDVIKKGHVQKRGYLLPTMREYWFVLQPTELTYYKSQDEKELCGSIALNTMCWVDSCQSSPKDKVQRFVLNTNDRSFELAAPDHRRVQSRLQWLSALQTAISHSGGSNGYQRGQVLRRRQQRVAELSRIIEENRRRSSQIQDMELTKAQLQQEKMEEKRLQELEDMKMKLEKLLEEETQAKRDEEIVRNLQASSMSQSYSVLPPFFLSYSCPFYSHHFFQARVAAEHQARELEAVHREEEKRLQELEDMKMKLEKLLEEETQAKRDEEIVRNLQARVLREEWEKRDELEKLQEEQRVLLDMEREKRIEFEWKQREKELHLQEAEGRLKQLEEERLQLDRELNAARDKITISERSKEVLEARLRVMEPQVREPDRVRRALSFMPSTKERPASLQTRYNSLRRTSDDK